MVADIAYLLILEKDEANPVLISSKESVQEVVLGILEDPAHSLADIEVFSVTAKKLKISQLSLV